MFLNRFFPIYPQEGSKLGKCNRSWLEWGTISAAYWKN
ncbi:hypothetical protein HMPREF1502_0769 [Klebsiella sp. AS10]|nr:hypothetical protein CSC12_3683 [Klebsiella michiganensis]EUB37447.1 hypothetical protein HMPREF1502_0769 [Klebsiella sp. AS10]